ncbi:hypothetical protein EON63_17735 [archaeon]|nr:MAG: hypothetical protein EON63_17735 [archaeon]
MNFASYPYKPPPSFRDDHNLITATTSIIKPDTIKLHQSLPWQARTLLKFFPPSPKTTTNISPKKKFLDKVLERITNRHLKTAVLFCMGKFDQLMVWCGNHRLVVSVVGKSVVGLYVGKKTTHISYVSMYAMLCSICTLALNTFACCLRLLYYFVSCIHMPIHIHTF